MTNPDLARDYYVRAGKRLLAIAVLFDQSAFADVVRESQEVVELVLKALLRRFGIAVPFSHEPSQSFLDNLTRFPPDLQAHIARFSEISRRLRRDRELAFYGSEDVTPSLFYAEADAREARGMAEEVVAAAASWLADDPS